MKTEYRGFDHLQLTSDNRFSVSAIIISKKGGDYVNEERRISGNVSVDFSSMNLLSKIAFSWVQANVDASQLTPEEYCQKYFEILERVKKERANLSQSKNRPGPRIL